MANRNPRRPKPWLEESRQGLSRYAWRFQSKKYWTPFYEDPEEARADATSQITDQLNGKWQEKQEQPGSRMLLEEWIGLWKGTIDVGSKTEEKYKYLTQFHILPEFQGRELGSLTFEEIETWEKAIPKRISSRGTPYAPSVASGARSLLITILGDAVHAHKIDWNPPNAAKAAADGSRRKDAALPRTWPPGRPT
jgi:hypothetical protein